MVVHSGLLWSFLLDHLGFSAPPSLSPCYPFPVLTQCDGCPDDSVWGIIAGLWLLPAMGAYYCLGAGWTQRRPLGLPGHPSSTQLNAVVKVYKVEIHFPNLSLFHSKFMVWRSESFAVRSGDHLRFNLGIISGLEIICGPAQSKQYQSNKNRW